LAGEPARNSSPDDADSLASEPEEIGADPLDPEPDFWRHPNQWRLWVMRQERRKAERAASVGSSRDPGRAAPVQLKSMPIKPFKGDQDDIDRFLRGCDAHFRLQRIDDDLDRIYAAGMMLEGRPAKWFGTYLCKISPKEAARHQVRFVEDPAFRKWETFEAGLRESYGGRVDRNTAVAEWNRLRYQGSINEFLDEISRLQWITNYQDEVVNDKLRMGLSKELAKEWSRVNPKPDPVNGQIALLREIGPTIENHERLEARRLKNRIRDPRRDQHRSESSSKNKSKSKKNRNSRSEFSSSPSSSSAPSFLNATQGVSKEVIAERKKEGVCLRCGRPCHRWSECRAKEAYQGKRKESEGETKPPAPKKPKTFDQKPSASAAVAARSEPSFEGGRIMEIPDDEDIDIDILGDT
jgi:hypothetical protein